MAINPTTVHVSDSYGHVPGLFGIRADGCRQYTPALFGWGPICDRCWIRDEAVRPLSSAVCPHGGAA